MRTASFVNSQSSMNSQRCASAVVVSNSSHKSCTKLTVFFALGDKLDKVKHALDNGSLEFVAALVPENATEECEHARLLARKL